MFLKRLTVYLLLLSLLILYCPNSALAKSIEFKCYTSNAMKVYLAGTFNSWKPKTMKKVSANLWKLSLDLKSGIYEYKFVIDDKWIYDKKNKNKIMNEHKTYNSVIEVKENTIYKPEGENNNTEKEIIIDFPFAQSVSIAGDWNQWAGSEIDKFDPLKCSAKRYQNGKWHYSLNKVSLGKHEFKFIINNKWESGNNRNINVTDSSLKLLFKKDNQINDIVRIYNKTIFKPLGDSTNNRKVTFYYIDSNAKEVFVAGDFNSWNQYQIPMCKGKNNHWKVSIELPPKRFRYKFIVDGKYKDDFFAKENSMIDVAKVVSISNQEEIFEYDFELYAPYALKVCIAGTFNDWSTNTHSLKDDDGDGLWRLKLKLKPGIYEYKFHIDSTRWINDPYAQFYWDLNSILIMPSIYKSNRDIKKEGKFKSWTLLNRVVALHQLGQLKLAYKMSIEILKNPNSSKSDKSYASLKAAMCLYHLGNTEDALDYITKAYEFYPRMSTTGIIHFEILAQNGASRKQLLNILKSSVQFKDFFSYNGLRYCWSKPSRDYFNFRALNKIFPKDKPVYFYDENLPGLSWTYFLEREFTEALEVLNYADRKIQRNNTFKRTRFYLQKAFIHLFKNDLYLAKNEFSKVLKFSKSDEFTHVFLKEIYKKNKMKKTNNKNIGILWGKIVDYKEADFLNKVGYNKLLTMLLDYKMETHIVDQSVFCSLLSLPIHSNINIEKKARDLIQEKKLKALIQPTFYNYGNSLETIVDIIFENGEKKQIKVRTQGRNKLIETAEIIKNILLNSIGKSIIITKVNRNSIYLNAGINRNIKEGDYYKTPRNLQFKITRVFDDMAQAEILSDQNRKFIKKGLQLFRTKKSLIEKTIRKKRQLKIENIHFYDLFSSIYKSYVNNEPIGMITLSNSLNVNLSDIKIRVLIPEFMSMPDEIILEKLFANTKKSIPVNATFNKDILNIDEEQTVKAKINISYNLNGEITRLERIKTLRIMAPNWLSWENPRMLGSFITIDDKILDLTRNIENQAFDQDLGIVSLDENIIKSISIFSSLGKHGLQYVKDPNSTLLSVDKSEIPIDFIQFPLETLKRKAGDCDDFSVLFSTCLESIGINTKFVLVPGHIFLLFETSIKKNDVNCHILPESMFFVENNKVYVPIECTRIGKPFLSAWKSGASQIHNFKNNPHFLTLDVNKIRSEYRPSYKPGIKFDEKEIDFSNLQSSITNEVVSLIEYSWDYLDKYVNLLNEDKRNVKLLNKIAVINAKSGNLDNAVSYINKACSITPSNYALIINRANINYLKSDLSAVKKDYKYLLNNHGESKDVIVSYITYLINNNDMDAAINFVATEITDAKTLNYVQKIFLGVDSEDELRAGEKKFDISKFRDVLKQKISHISSMQKNIRSAKIKKKKLNLPLVWLHKL